MTSSFYTRALFSPERSVKHFLLPASWCVTRYSGCSSRGCSVCSDSLSPLCSLIIDSTKHHLCNLLSEMVLRSGSPIVCAKLYCSQQAKHVPAWHFLAGSLSSPLVITIVLLTVTVQDTFSLQHIKHGVPWRLHEYLIYFLCFVFCIMKYSVGG